MSTDIEIKLPKPHKGQQQVLASKAKFKMLLCGRRWGKSLVAQIIAIQKMLAGEKVAYVTPQFKLGKDFFRNILKVLPPQLVAVDNKTDLRIELITGGVLQFHSGEALGSFRGTSYHYVIIDEAAFIPALKDGWGSEILNTLIDYDGGVLAVSTPHGKEMFYSLYTKGLNKEVGYESFHYTTFDNPHLKAEAINEIKNNLTQSQINEELYAIAGENSNNPFGTSNINKNIIQTLSSEPTVVYGIDVTYGTPNDYTVICGLDANGTMSYFDRFQSSTTLIQHKIESLPKKVLKVIDSTAGGNVLYQSLQQTTSNIIGFKFTTESKPKLMIGLIKAVEAGSLRYNEITANEMHTFESSISAASGHVKYQAMQGFHDDCICALAIANKYRNQASNAANWRLYFA